MAVTLAVADYYVHINTPTFYPSVDIVFDVLPGLRYHVPLLVRSVRLFHVSQELNGTAVPARRSGRGGSGPSQWADR